MARPVTVRDVARVAEVSISTVSRVLNNQGNTKDDVRERVLKAASELGYHKQITQNPLYRTTEKTLQDIGFLLDYSGVDEPTLDTFWARILHGAESEALKHNIHVTYQGIRHNQTSYDLMTMFLAMRAGGFMLVGPSGRDTIGLLQQTELPFVLVDNYLRLPGQPLETVMADNFEGAREAVNYLISQGHQRIALLDAYILTGARQRNIIYTFERRKDGYLAALREAGLPMYPTLIEACDLGRIDDVYAACQRLLNAGVPFSALFCVSDATAMMAIRALREQGRRIPEDISIIGFDDIEMAEHLTPALTTVHVNKETMGAIAVKRLLERFSAPLATGLTTIVDVSLVKRASVLPYR